MVGTMNMEMSLVNALVRDQHVEAGCRGRFDKIDSANVFSWRHGGRGYYIVSHANRGWLWA